MNQIQSHQTVCYGRSKPLPYRVIDFSDCFLFDHTADSMGFDRISFDIVGGDLGDKRKIPRSGDFIGCDLKIHEAEILHSQAERIVIEENLVSGGKHIAEHFVDL